MLVKPLPLGKPMRLLLTVGLLLVAGCAGSLYTHFAGPTAKPPAEVYDCVKEQLKTLGYARKQFDEQQRWYLAEKATKEAVSSGLYEKTLHVLETRVKQSNGTTATLDIIARTYDVFATARGEDRQERKASERVLLDARTLGQACSAP
jgi:hypothetical protein